MKKILEKKMHFYQTFMCHKQQKTENITLHKFFEPAFIALVCFGIDMFPNPYHYRCLRKTMSVINIILTLSAIIIGIKIIANINTDNVLFGSFLTGFFFKWLLYRKRKEIHIFIMYANKNKYMMKCMPYIFTFRRKFIFVLVSVIVFLSAWCIVATPNLNEDITGKEKINLCSIVKNYNVSFPETTCRMEPTLNFIIPLIFSGYPFNVFFILFTGIAWQLKVALNYFEKQISIVRPSYQQIFNDYCDLCNLVDVANEVFSIILLIAIIYISCCVYFTINWLMMSWMGLSFLNMVALLPVFYSFCQIFVMLHVGHGIVTANKSLLNLILQIPHDSTSTTDKLFLAIKMQQEFGLSIGSMFILKRGLFLTIVGTIFTYLLLIKSLIN